MPDDLDTACLRIDEREHGGSAPDLFRRSTARGEAGDRRQDRGSSNGGHSTQASRPSAQDT